MTQNEEKNQSIKTDREQKQMLKQQKKDIRTVCNCIPYVQKEKWLCEKY